MFRIYRSLGEIGPEAGPSAVTIGNFDGVHIGHHRIFQRVIATARENGWIPSVLTFDPHPTKVVAPARAPRLLGSLEERCWLMQAEGLEQIFVLPFNRAFSELSPQAFVADILVRALQAKAVLVGDNFRFGNQQAGDVRLLAELGREMGFATEIIPGVCYRGQMVSSSRIRQLLDSGNVSLAWRYLGRPFAVEGAIVSGHGIGSKQTVPTLNLDTKAEILPASGVYVTRTHELNGARTWASITNVGFRPTFNGDKLTVETFLLDRFDGEPPATIRLEFLRRVREERKFDTPADLRTQIMRDVSVAQAWFRRCEKWKRGQETRG